MKKFSSQLIRTSDGAAHRPIKIEEDHRIFALHTHASQWIAEIALGKSIALICREMEKAEMRTLARAAIIVVLLGFCAVPMLRGGRPTDTKLVSSTISVSRNWLSEPTLLLFLGVGLVVAASLMPGLVRSRGRVSHLQAGDHEEERNSPLEKADIHPNGLLAVEPSARVQAQWPEQSRASDGTLS